MNSRGFSNPLFPTPPHLATRSVTCPNLHCSRGRDLAFVETRSNIPTQFSAVYDKVTMPVSWSLHLAAAEIHDQRESSPATSVVDGLQLQQSETHAWRGICGLFITKFQPNSFEVGLIHSCWITTFSPPPCFDHTKQTMYCLQVQVQADVVEKPSAIFAWMSRVTMSSLSKLLIRQELWSSQRFTGDRIYSTKTDCVSKVAQTLNSVQFCNWRSLVTCYHRLNKLISCSGAIFASVTVEPNFQSCYSRP